MDPEVFLLGCLKKNVNVLHYQVIKNILIKAQLVVAAKWKSKKIPTVAECIVNYGKLLK